MQVSLRKVAVAALTATALAFGSISGAQAAWGGHGGHWGGGHWGGGHWGGGWGGFWPGFAGGVALGAVASSWPYWGGGYYGSYAYDPYMYGDYGYAPYPYAYGPSCYIRRHVVIDRWGHRLIRRVRVCY